MYRSYIARGAMFFLDGVPDRFGTVGERPASWFDKVEFVRMAPIPGAGFGPGIYFYTKRGAPQEFLHTDALGMISTRIIGYSLIRKFYSPQYDDQSLRSEKKDFRSTLYWNPIVRTDSTGVTNVSFYNSDQTGEVQVVVEGITSDGKLCRGLCRYNVTH